MTVRLDWTDEEKRLMREQYGKLTAAQIAQALGRGRTPTGVREQARKMGLTSPHKLRRLTDEQAREAETLLRQGVLLREIAVKFGRSIGDISKQMARVGVSARAIKEELKAARKAAKPAGVGSVKAAKRRPGNMVFRQRDHGGQSLADQAANHLRRDYAPVYHRGRENKRERGIWQVGSKKLSEAAMIELARDKGMGREAKPAAALVIRSTILEAQNGHRGAMQAPAGYELVKDRLSKPRTMFDARAA